MNSFSQNSTVVLVQSPMYTANDLVVDVVLEAARESLPQ